MKTQTKPTGEERKMKLAEAGIMFALVLAITVFVGVKFASNDQDVDTVTNVVEQPAVSGDVSPVEIIVATEVIAVEPDIIPEDTIAVSEVESAAPRVVTYAMAEQAYLDGNFDESTDLFNQYTAEHPLNAWGFYMLGLAQWKAGENAGAEAAFLAALELKPDHQKSLINYGRVLLAMDRPEEARLQLEAALAANPASMSAQRVLARTYHNLGQLPAALAAYEAVLRTDGDDVWALNNLGLIHIQQENFADAVAPLARAAALRDTEACIQNNLGVALERLGQYRAAELAFTRALATDPDYAKADQSLDRVSKRTESNELIPVDLAALAAGFTTGPAADAGTEPAEVEMEVATAAVIPEAEPVEIPTVTSDDPDCE